MIWINLHNSKVEFWMILLTELLQLRHILMKSGVNSSQSSFHSISIRLRSWLWLGPCKRWIFFVRSPSVVDLLPCFGSLSCFITQLSTELELVQNHIQTYGFSNLQWMTFSIMTREIQWFLWYYFKWTVCSQWWHMIWKCFMKNLYINVGNSKGFTYFL